MMDVLKQIEGELSRQVEDYYNVRHLVHFLEGYRGYVLRNDNPYSPDSARHYSYDKGYERAKRDFFYSM